MSVTTVVLADACVLINLVFTGRLSFCRDLPEKRFVIPQEVLVEIREPQRSIVDSAIEDGWLSVERITAIATFQVFNQLTVGLGRGEAACISLAVENGWSIASDEKGRFRAEVKSRLRLERLMGTKELYLYAIQAGILTVAEADEDKRILEGNRFRMTFASFRDLL